ncbi:MAG: FAD:protein FMN transferase [Deltaproteobacteria bacterium]|nr:FAD:protein FMN transferase [Deltaproteobacteria bacterium]
MKYLYVLVFLLFSCSRTEHKQNSKELTESLPSGFSIVNSSSGTKKISASREYMDTVFTITVSLGVDKQISGDDISSAVNSIKSAFEEIRRIQSIMSSHNSSGDIFSINEAHGKAVKISKDTSNVIETAINVSSDTSGAFDITWATYRELYRIKKSPWKPPSGGQIEKLKEYAGFRNISLIKSGKETQVKIGEKTKVDLGGIAKGYALKKAGEILTTDVISGFIVNGGGDLVVSGKGPDRDWIVGIRHPRGKERNSLYLTGSVSHPDSMVAVVTSGDYERFVVYNGKRYNHIINTATGLPSDGAVSATVIGKDAALADALATSLMVSGLKGTAVLKKKYPGYAWMIFDSNLKEHRSENFNKIFKIHVEN